MELQIKIHVCKFLEESKEVVDRLIENNIENKLDSYLKKFNKADSEGTMEISLEKNKKGEFNGKIQATLDGNSYRSEREDFKNLDDLINHLFDHVKVQLAD
ncbi:MAG: hypothetical protein GY828_04200 [Candidatus Gracilibacteria bacterium]|nr:hypothetical protein [Candidatus Gracilibacteria bacterium]